LAPISEPALRTRGYFVYALEASSDAPAVAALRKWLVAAGSLAETEFATYLSANCAARALAKRLRMGLRPAARE
jgi:hypothetical protein